MRKECSPFFTSKMKANLREAAGMFLIFLLGFFSGGSVGYGISVHFRGSGNEQSVKPVMVAAAPIPSIAETNEFKQLAFQLEQLNNSYTLLKADMNGYGLPFDELLEKACFWLERKKTQAPPPAKG